MVRLVSCLAVLVALLGCTTTPEPTPARLVELGPGESLKVDHIVLVSDGSHSMTEEGKIQSERLLAESFVAGMPDGTYVANGLLFGGDSVRETAEAPFDRDGLAGWAASVRYLDPTTPFVDVLGRTESGIAGEGGRVAVVLFSDGITTWGDPGAVTSAGRSLVSNYRGGSLCIYTVQLGNDPEGKQLLESLAGLAPCGGSQSGAALRDAGSMNAFQRSIFVQTGAAPPPPPPTPTAGPDPCGGILRLRGVTFGFDKADIRPEDEVILDEAARVLNMCGSKRVKVEGHTDSTGPEAYNQALSQRRARAVASYLTAHGITQGRLTAVGLGEAEPVASNATREGRALNRRVEFDFE
ncbi:MAG: OmpA family protein [Myxococcota bacterium]